MNAPNKIPDWARADFDLKAQPLPLPGPVRASERIALKGSRRPSLKAASINARTVRKELLRKYGEDYWKSKRFAIEARRSLKVFVAHMWEVLEPGTKLVWGKHIDVICEVLERVTRREPGYSRVLINVPPGHMKSLLVSVFWPAWQLLENPGHRALFVTYVQKLSNRDSMRARALIESPRYQALIPAVYGPKYDQKWELTSSNIEIWRTSLHGERTSTSVDGAGTGLRGDDIVIDDPMNADEYPTPEALEKITSWYDTRIANRLNDMGSGAIVIICQRLHENDLPGHVLAMDEAQRNNPQWPKFKHVCLASEYDPDHPNEFDWRTAKGELLFSGKFPAHVIANEKYRLGAQYSAQHDQRPVSAAGGIFPMSRLCFWYPLGHTPVPLPHREKDRDGNEIMCKQGPLPTKFEAQVQSWDLAFKDLKTSDYVAGQIWARALAHLYLIDETHGHLGFTASLDAIRTMSANYPHATTKYVEDKANGPAVIEVLDREIFGLDPVEPDGGKIARAWAVEPVIAAGDVWLPHPDLYPWVRELLKELRNFPKGKNDDRVDALTQAIRKLALHAAAYLRAMTRK